MIKRSFTLEVGDGEHVDGEVRLPAGPPPRAAVVIVHGFKGFKDWAFFPHVAEELAAEGFAAVTFNFSRNGVVRAAPMEFTDLERFATNTFSREVAELRRVIDATLGGEVSGRPHRRVGLLGHSRGGGTAILVGAQDPRIEALVTWGAVSTFDRWSKETVAEWREAGRLHVLNGRTGQQMPLDSTLLEDYERNRGALDIMESARHLTMPWLIVHGDQDTTVLPDDAHRLVQASPVARLVLIEEGGHTFNAAHPFEESPPALDAAVAATVRYFGERLSRD